MALQLRDLAALDDPPASADGQPMLVAIGLIDEDPAQPRSEFDPVTLQELASTIAERGICQPVSVRAHPEAPGRYMLNFGARRLRAARLAGKHEIPAFVAEGGDAYAQVIENEQREDLKPLELAMFIERRLKAGESLTEVARRLGKSRTYLTFVSALIAAPDWLLELYHSGKCRGATELYELRRMHEEAPEPLRQWMNGRDTISRNELAAFREQSRTAESRVDTDDRPPEDVTSLRAATCPPSKASSDHAGPRDRRRPLLQADYRGSVVGIDLTAIPDEDGTVFVRGVRGERQAVSAADLRLLRVIGVR